VEYANVATQWHTILSSLGQAIEKRVLSLWKNCPIVPNRFSILRCVPKRSSTIGPPPELYSHGLEKNFNRPARPAIKGEICIRWRHVSATAAASGSSCHRRCIRHRGSFVQNKKRERERERERDAQAWTEKYVRCVCFASRLYHCSTEVELSKVKILYTRLSLKI